MSTEILLAIISSGTLSAIVSGVINLISQWQAKKSGEAAGLQILLKDRIKHLSKSYLERGVITTEELEDLMEMHHIYHRLGGNGFLDKLMVQVHTLRLTPSPNNQTTPPADHAEKAVGHPDRKEVRR